MNKEDQRSDTNQEVEIADDFNILKQEIDEFQQKINAQLMVMCCVTLTIFFSPPFSLLSFFFFSFFPL